MADIIRDFDRATNERFDVIIVGGGIYGSMLMLEAVRAGLKPLLLEKSDFGSGTSFNNLRIVHGGLRYLQTLNFPRIRESVSERRWFLNTFPDLIRPLPCLMPLYGGLTKNRLVMSVALHMNDWLTRHRNDDMDYPQHLPNCTLLSAAETLEHFPQVRANGLKGGALWYDAVMPDCQRVQLEVLRWAVAGGGTALNYAGVSGLIVDEENVRGVQVNDELTEGQYEFRADVVINATGPACREFARQHDIDYPQLFRPSHAWNILLDKPPLSADAIAVQAPESGSRVFFAHSLGDRLLIGTGHAAMSNDDDNVLSRSKIEQMLNEFTRAVPGLQVGMDDIIRIFSGQLPVSTAATTNLSDKPVILDHLQHGGRRGLFTVSGVKYTTSRSTAQAAIKKILQSTPELPNRITATLPERPASTEYRLNPDDCPLREDRIGRMRQLIGSEAAQTLSDVLLRRSNLASNPEKASEVAAECCEAFGWEAEECSANVASFKREIAIPNSP